MSGIIPLISAQAGRRSPSPRRLPPLVAGTCVLVLVALLGADARAQTFPVDEADWVPLPCRNLLKRNTLMTDLHRDDEHALDERDLVGWLGAPAGYAASDNDFLFIRLRVDQDPTNAPPQGRTLERHAWGLAVSVDNNLRNYEILMSMNGEADAVELYQNTITTASDILADPADGAPASSYPFGTHGRVEQTEDSRYGGDADYFVSMAVPWRDLERLGLTPVTAAVAWAGTSSLADRLDGDLACHDGTGAALSPEEYYGGFQTVLDPHLDSDNDGYTDRDEYLADTDPSDRTSHPTGPLLFGVDLEGGGGCSVTRGTGGGGWPTALLLLAMVLIRRRAPRP